MAAFPLDPSLLLKELTGTSHAAGLGGLAFLSAGPDDRPPLDCSSSAVLDPPAAPLHHQELPPVQQGNRASCADRKRKSQEVSTAGGAGLCSAQPKDGREVRGRKIKRSSSAREAEECKGAGNGVDEKGYIHVRARRGQATDSHSLAERVRREKISERMKMLQALVPGCDKVTGKALILDEIINYVQSLQNQVEFLSMRIASMSPVLYGFGAVDLDNLSDQAQKIGCAMFQDPLPLMGQTNPPHGMMSGGGGVGPLAASFGLPSTEPAAALAQGGVGMLMQQAAGGQRQELLHQVVLGSLRPFE